jgi:hypothetical protein
MAARCNRRPPQRGHANTSTPKMRRISSDHVSRSARVWVSLAGVSGGGAGRAKPTTSARRSEWARARLRRARGWRGGLGTWRPNAPSARSARTEDGLCHRAVDSYGAAHSGRRRASRGGHWRAVAAPSSAPALRGARVGSRGRVALNAGRVAGRPANANPDRVEWSLRERRLPRSTARTRVGSLVARVAGSLGRVAPLSANPGRVARSNPGRVARRVGSLVGSLVAHPDSRKSHGVEGDLSHRAGNDC